MSVTNGKEVISMASNPVRILVGDVLEGLQSLPSGSVHCTVTSPPYW